MSEQAASGLPATTPPRPTILLVGTADTKRDELAFMRDELAM